MTQPPPIHTPGRRSDPAKLEGRLTALAAAIRHHHLDAATEQDRALLASADLRRLTGGRNNTAYACRLGEQHACVKVYRVDERNRAHPLCQARVRR